MKSIPATVLEQFIIDFDSPHFYFVHDPLSNLDSFSLRLTHTPKYSARDWDWDDDDQAEAERTEKKILIWYKFIIFHYTFWPIRVVFSRSSLLLLLMFFAATEETTKLKWMLKKTSQRSLKWFIIALNCFVVDGDQANAKITAKLCLLSILPFHLISSLENVKIFLRLPFSCLICFAAKGKKLFTMFVVEFLNQLKARLKVQRRNSSLSRGHKRLLIMFWRFLSATEFEFAVYGNLEKVVKLSMISD